MNKNTTESGWLCVFESFMWLASLVFFVVPEQLKLLRRVTTLSGRMNWNRSGGTVEKLIETPTDGACYEYMAETPQM